MKNKKIIIISAAVLSLLLVFGAIFTFTMMKKNEVVSTIILDLNPSIKLSLNKEEEVVKMEGLNEEGIIICEKCEYKDLNLEETIKNLTNVLIKEEYLKSKQNKIIFNTDSKTLSKKVITSFTSQISKKEINCEVIEVDISDNAKKNASKYKISEVKASYIESLIEENKELEFKQLANKSINEIDETVLKLQKKQEEDKKKQEEDKKKQEEETKQEENKNEEGYGSDLYCENVAVGLTSEEAANRVFNILNVQDEHTKFRSQTIASRYNNVCCYETTVIFNKTKYKVYMNITDGSYVGQTSVACLAGTHEDIAEIVKAYFMSNFGASEFDVLLTSTGEGGIDEEFVSANAKYKDSNYRFTINKLSGVIVSVSN